MIGLRIHLSLILGLVWCLAGTGEGGVEAGVDESLAGGAEPGDGVVTVS